AAQVVYLAASQVSNAGGAFMGDAKLYLRTGLRPMDAEAIGRQLVEAGNSPLRNVRTVSLQEGVSCTYFNDPGRRQCTLVFAVLALVILASGLHGLLAYWVSQRTREIGVRMALGSTSGRVVRLVLRQSLGLVAFGLFAGIPLAVWLVRALASLVFEVP